jgi:hypothetical protein
VTRSRGLGALVVAVALAFPGASLAADAPLGPEIDRLAASAAALGAGTPPAQLEASVERLGELVSRARAEGAPPTQQQRLLETAERLSSAAESARHSMEARAGDDEAALEALYRSTDWQRLDYVDGLLGYWRAWAAAGRAQALPAGPERKKLLQQAERGFSRSASELRLPGLARSSLLGLGAVRRELGDRDGAREALTRLEKLLGDGSDPPTLASVRFELAVLAFQDGDLARGRALAAQLAQGGRLTPAQQIGLARVEAEALLSARRAGKAGPEASAEAAALLRQLSSGGGVAGDEGGRAAMALLLAYRHELEGQDVGAAGALVTAESAFEAKRWAEARDAYAQALGGGAALPESARDVARYKYAVALAQTGARSEASSQLEGLLAGGAKRLDPALRAPAARLAFTLARVEASESKDAAAEARLAAAADRLLALAPDAPEAADAKLVAALSKGEGAAGRRAALEAVAPGSAGYGVARYELVRDRAAELGRLEEQGRVESAEGRRVAAALAADLDTVTRLAGEGKLDAALASAPTLAVLRARAASSDGEAPDAVLARIAAAEARPGLDAGERRSLARLRAKTLARAGRFPELEATLARSDAAALADDAAGWLAVLQELDAQRSPAPPPALVIGFATRLREATKGAVSEAAGIVETRALVRAGKAEDAARLAESLVAADAASGDARVALARAFDASGDAASAARVWGEVAGGVERGSGRWLEATLARVAAQRKDGDAAGACATLSAALEGEGGDAAARSALARAAEGCPSAAR